MNNFLKLLFISLFSIGIFVVHANAQTAEFEMDAEIVAAIKEGNSDKLKRLLAAKGVDLTVDTNVAQLVQFVQNKLSTASVTELSAAVKSITNVVTSAIVESKVEAGESVTADVLVEAVIAATVAVTGSANSAGVSDEFAAAVSNGASAAVTKAIVKAKADIGETVTDADIVSAVEEAIQVVVASGGDAKAAIAGAAEEAVTEGVSQSVINFVERTIQQEYNVKPDSDSQTDETSEEESGSEESTTDSSDNYNGGGFEIPEIPDEQIVSPV